MATTDLNAFGENLDLSAEGFRFGLVVSSWNDQITSSLAEGAKELLISAGANPKDIICWEVPGTFELVYGSSRMMNSGTDLDAIIAIGSVIQGETRHFEFVCQAASQGIARLNEKGEVPVIFCVLTDDKLEQAIDRSGGKHGNKGVEAAAAAVRMAHLKRDSLK
jgi:6,7-dimethyl-8-ribityllumazine synthase